MTTKITKASYISVGLAITMVGVTWKLSETNKQVEFNTAAIQSISGKLDRILELKTDIEVIKSQVTDLKKPLINTQFNVKRVNARLNKIAGPVRSTSLDLSGNCYTGPFSMMGKVK
jgi:ADP-dependent phosphofructokinase/glucokinase